MTTEISKAWICLVCGYVHYGDTPPETCPVCGAPATDFELHTTKASPAKNETGKWRCVICGYEHDGDSPCETCPVCGASRNDFEPVEPTTPSNAAEQELISHKIVIIGGGIAGVSAAEHARLTAPHAEVVLYAKEPQLPYYRLNLTRYLAGEVDAEALPVHPAQWYAAQRIQLELGVEARAIDPEAHTVKLSDGTRVNYDKLILACGAHPFIPPITGSDNSGVVAVRAKSDADALLAQIGVGAPCVCIGGGILGLETAGALARRGAAVSLLEGFDHLLPRQLNKAAAAVLEKHVAGLGVNVYTNANTSEIKNENKTLQVVLESGTALPAHTVTITTGVRANTHLARRAGLQVQNGIVVDSRLRTSNADIFAAGDAAQWDGIVYGLWEPARRQGAVAGQNAAGADIAFGGMPRMNTLKVLGIDLFSIGVITAEDGGFVEIAEETDGVYRRFLFHDNRLVGAILIGDAKIAASATRAIKEHADLSHLMLKKPAAQDIVEYLSA